ncbi:MAG: enoyl-CoA hydratase/isomerase family protein [Pseudomonadales bacterium]|jgi:2-(1,2-epoxy-1,2-dihydrophenyl)acetyl-CoA isomerase|nr:enoyl-CoA hydratase/isomerase family protein [Pseudomonadales bacterium]MCP5319981.1 enoyl-CoA hydratase/isomerase family protein [Pseudomonadales bacterium]MCP5338272.1 enoyl-CoA hydratase/isomerase family protein [Pseudomonadales bacterium]
MSAFNTIEFTREAAIARITLNRPDSANGISLEMASELLQASLDCRHDDSVRAVVLGANGRMFCAGGDINGFASNATRLQSHLKELTLLLHAAISNLARMRAPLIVAVNGAAAGAGFSLALCGDLVLAARSARFTLAYTAIGLVPDGGATYFLPRVVGLRRAQELILSNRRLAAEEALEWGIVTQVVEDTELPEAATALATRIASGPTRAFGAVKRMLAASYHSTLETQMDLEGSEIAAASVTADGREGVSAFLAKRAAVFTGG